MNLNPVFEELQNEIGYPVVQDMYQGEEPIYGVYTYEDERGALYGDNKPLEDTAYMRVQIYTPMSYNYMALKHQTRDFLENRGFIITGIKSWLESRLDGKAEKIRCTVLEIEYTGAHSF